MVLVSISDVVEATLDRSRCLIEGERVLDGNMLITVGSTGLSDRKILRVWALCLQSSTLTAPPHVLELSLNLKTIYNRVVDISCSCKAGKSEKCKHCIALLMFLNRINDPSELEDLSCTDLTQQWGKLKKAALSEFEAKPLSEFCHFTPPVPIYSSGIPVVSDEEAANFANLIIEGATKSEVYLHSRGARAAASIRNCVSDPIATEVVSKRQAAGKLTEILLRGDKMPCFQHLKDMTERKVGSLSPDLLNFYKNNVEVSLQQSVMIASNTATQCEAEWDAARSVRMTGTKVYKLFTYSRNSDPDWPKKLKALFNSSSGCTADMLHGLQFEPHARNAYVKKTAQKVIENGILIHPELPWLGTSVDGVVFDENENPIKIIEIKCLAAGKTKTANLLPKIAECYNKKTLKLKTKHQYNGQIQLGMFLLGLKSCDLLLYASVDDTYASQTVSYDDDFVREMLTPLVDIYFDLTLPYLLKKTQESDNEEEVE
ncbi:Hemogen [Frankliniella fusca]|uniref:Hemogen n=1 Tax=Frankliniella fusca TaxID=407009 RepID=A0AAE1GWK9_9NEOP|nr:Hemogen [Frankliniella fusca]